MKGDDRRARPPARGGARASTGAMAADGLVTLPSSFGPKETMDRLEAAIKAKGDYPGLDGIVIAFILLVAFGGYAFAQGLRSVLELPFGVFVVCRSASEPLTFQFISEKACGSLGLVSVLAADTEAGTVLWCLGRCR